MTKDVLLPSGANLKITLSPFAVSRALYQAILEEGKTLALDPTADVDVNLFKDLFCAGFSSKKIEAALEECFKKCLYNTVHITKDTFEPEEARQDYPIVCWEVAYANISPFLKHLSQLSKAIEGLMPKSPIAK